MKEASVLTGSLGQKGTERVTRQAEREVMRGGGWRGNEKAQRAAERGASQETNDVELWSGQGPEQSPSSASCFYNRSLAAKAQRGEGNGPRSHSTALEEMGLEPDWLCSEKESEVQAGTGR